MVSPCKKKKQLESSKQEGRDSRENAASSKNIDKREKLKKPLLNKKFYLDIKNQTVFKRLEEKLKALGGEVEVFIVEDVNYVVTDRTEFKQQNGTSSSGIYSHSPILSISPASTASPSDGALSTTRRRTRAEVMLHKVKSLNVKESDVLDLASTWKIPIYSFKTFTSWIEKLYKRIKSPQEFPPSEATTTTIVKELRGRFLKVETTVRPEFKEFNSWPEISFDPDRAGLVQLNNNIYDHERLEKNNSPAQQRMTRRLRGASSNCGGYCELCHINYVCFDSHISSASHIKFATTAQMYEELDELINKKHNHEASTSGRTLRSYKSPPVCNGYKSTSPPLINGVGSPPISPRSSRYHSRHSSPVPVTPKSKSNGIISSKTIPKECKPLSKPLMLPPPPPPVNNSKIRSRVNRHSISTPPRKLQTTKKRLSVQEKLIEDNKSYFKVEVLNSKLRSTGNLHRQLEAAYKQVNGDVNITPVSSIKVKEEPVDSIVNVVEVPNEAEAKTPPPVVVRFKKVRKSALALLSDEAENFMFGNLIKKEQPENESTETNRENVKKKINDKIPKTKKLVKEDNEVVKVSKKIVKSVNSSKKTYKSESDINNKSNVKSDSDDLKNSKRTNKRNFKSSDIKEITNGIDKLAENDVNDVECETEKSSKLVLKVPSLVKKQIGKKFRFKHKIKSLNSTVKNEKINHESDDTIIYNKLAKIIANVKKEKSEKCDTAPVPSTSKVQVEEQLSDEELRDRSENNELYRLSEIDSFLFQHSTTRCLWDDTYERQDLLGEKHFPQHIEYPIVLLPYECPTHLYGEKFGRRRHGRRRPNERLLLDDKPRKSPRCHASTLAILSNYKKRKSRYITKYNRSNIITAVANGELTNTDTNSTEATNSNNLDLNEYTTTSNNEVSQEHTDKPPSTPAVTVDEDSTKSSFQDTIDSVSTIPPQPLSSNITSTSVQVKNEPVSYLNIARNIEYVFNKTASEIDPEDKYNNAIHQLLEGVQENCSDKNLARKFLLRFPKSFEIEMGGTCCTSVDPAIFEDAACGIPLPSDPIDIDLLALFEEAKETIAIDNEPPKFLEGLHLDPNYSCNSSDCSDIVYMDTSYYGERRENKRRTINTIRRRKKKRNLTGWPALGRPRKDNSYRSCPPKLQCQKNRKNFTKRSMSEKVDNKAERIARKLHNVFIRRTIDEVIESVISGDILPIVLENVDKYFAEEHNNSVLNSRREKRKRYLSTNSDDSYTFVTPKSKLNNSLRTPHRGRGRPPKNRKNSSFDI